MNNYDIPSMDHQPLLAKDEYSDGYFDDALIPPIPYEDDGGDLLTGPGIVPPNPFDNTVAGEENVRNEDRRYDNDENDDEEEEDRITPTACIERLGFIIGTFIGVTAQLSTLAGNFVNVTLWGSEGGPYATSIFVLWCCFMSTMFFVAFALLRAFVQFSFEMIYDMEADNAQNEPVADLPSDSPLFSPGPPLHTFASIRREAYAQRTYSGHSGSSSNTNSSSHASSQHSEASLDPTSFLNPPQNQHELLDDIMWHMKCYYVVGVAVGISLSWVVTNLVLGDQRVNMTFSLAPPALAILWFRWMKNDEFHHTKLSEEGQEHDGSSEAQEEQTTETDYV